MFSGGAFLLDLVMRSEYLRFLQITLIQFFLQLRQLVFQTALMLVESE